MPTPAKYNQDVIEQLRSYAAQGISSAQAASFFEGMTRSAAMGLAWRNKIQFKAPRFGRVTDEKRSPRQRRRYMVCQEVEKLPGNLTIYELTDSNCKFIFGDVALSDYRYCGQRVVDGYSWCQDHCKICFQQDDQSHAKPIKPFRSPRSY